MSFTLHTDIPVLDERHDNRHDLEGRELARESLAYMLQIPDEGIGGFLYTWVSSAGLAGAAACFFGPGVGDTPIFEVCDGIPVAESMDFNDWQVQGLRLQLKQPLKTALVSFKGERVEIDYHFEGVHPAYAYSTHANGCPKWMADDRFEQQGKVHGRLKIDGREISYNTVGQRDHSWGTREWGVNQHWSWLHGQAGDGIGVHFWKLFAMGKSHLCGFVYKDGEMAQVSEVEMDFEYNERTLAPVWLTAVLTDSLGRTTDVKTQSYGAFPFPVDPMATMFETPQEMTIDGHSGCGWLEMMWPTGLVNYCENKFKQ